MGTTRALLAVAAVGVAVALAGCGGEKAAEVDTKPFEAAIVEYLRVNSMGMKPDKFEAIEVAADRATATVRMATADDLYGMKPKWTFEFHKQDGKWVVAKSER